MAGSLNKVTLIGNVGKDPEIRTTQGGMRIGNLTVATSESWNDKASGERKERTEWHRVVCFNDKLTGIIEKYVSKGSKVYLEGALQTRKWTDQSGQERYSTEVVLQGFDCKMLLLSAKEGGGSQGRQESDRGSGQQRTTGTAWRTARGQEDMQRGAAGDLDDEIPF